MEKYLNAKSTQYHCMVVLTIIALLYICIIIYYCDDSVLYSEDEPQETFPASRVISSQILGYDGGEVDTKERVEVIFPVHVSLSFICLQLYGR